MMKIRTGFVSNSSSSSFVCDVCGKEGAEMMSFCHLGHTICYSHMVLLSQEQLMELAGKYVKAHHEYFPDGVPQEIRDFNGSLASLWGCLDALGVRGFCEFSEICPICQMKAFTDTDLLNFLLLEYDYKRSDVEIMLKSAFDTYVNFQEVINERQKGK